MYVAHSTLRASAADSTGAHDGISQKARSMSLRRSEADQKGVAKRERERGREREIEAGCSPANLVCKKNKK